MTPQRPETRIPQQACEARVHIPSDERNAREIENLLQRFRGGGVRPPSPFDARLPCASSPNASGPTAADLIADSKGVSG